MMKLFKSHVLVLSLIVALQGCSTNSSIQRYSATGPVTLVDDSQVIGAVFWDRQEGRHWYGAKLKKVPNVVQLKVCHKDFFEKSFKPTLEEQLLVIPGKRGDTLEYQINQQGELEPATQNALNCAHLWQEGKPAILSKLEQGKYPTLFITCSTTKDNRYPKTGKYLLETITKQPVENPETPYECPI